MSLSCREVVVAVVVVAMAATSTEALQREFATNFRDERVKRISVNKNGKGSCG